MTMIIPDINLLIYAYNSSARNHATARGWWEGTVESNQEVGVPWVVAMGYVRIMSSPRVMPQPISAETAIKDVRSWFAVPNVNTVGPGPRHLDILSLLLREIGVGGSLTTDAHLAAIAIEHQAELYSNDADFSRFSGLNWINPLA